MFEQISACELQELCNFVINKNKPSVARLKGTTYEIIDNPYRKFMDIDRLLPTPKYYSKRSMAFRKTVDFLKIMR